MSDLSIICLTPIKNEAWILDRFLRCTNLWADHIVIADQHSTDRSTEIAANYPKVKFIANPSSNYSEIERQKILINAARQFPQPRLLITLDADEFLTANFKTSPEWNTVLQTAPGTVIKFQRAELMPDLNSYWLVNGDFAWGFMDDGSDHAGTKIHSPRVPIPANAPTITLRDIKVLHYQNTDWERMKSKHRWYQCWERLNQPHRRASDIYRQYHHMDTISPSRINSLPGDWLAEYKDQGIDMTSVYREPILWWDREVLAWLEKYGTQTFKREAIWDVDWAALSRLINPDNSHNFDYSDPRSRIDKRIHGWLKKTQGNTSNRKVQFIHKLLGFLGW